MAEFWVRPTNGDDANAGTSFAAAKQTIQAAYQASAAFDVIYLVAEADLLLTAQLVLPVNTGGVVAARVFIGVNSSGVEDGTQFVIRPGTMDAAQETAAASVPMVLVPNFSSTETNRNIFKNIRFDAGGKFRNGASAALKWQTWYGCTFENAISHGLQTEVNSLQRVAYCTARFNGSGGFRAERDTTYFYCRAHNNSDVGFRVAQGFMIGCVADGNGWHGFDIFSTVSPFATLNCVAHGNGGHGFDLRNLSSTGVAEHCSGCIATSNTRHGFATTGNILDCVAGTGSTVNGWGATHANIRPTNLSLLDVEYLNAAAGDFRLADPDTVGRNMASAGLFNQTGFVAGLDINPRPPGAGGSPITIAHFG